MMLSDDKMILIVYTKCLNDNATVFLDKLRDRSFQKFPRQLF